MQKIPKGGLLGQINRTVRWLASFRVGLYAAYTSFFMILSLFPGLVLLLGLLRYAGLDGNSLLAVIEGFVPEVLLPMVRRIVLSTYQNTTGTVLSLSVAVALWSASRGIYGLVIGLNAIYGVRESRGYFYTRLVSMGYMFAFLIVLLLTLLLNVFGTSLLQSLPADTPFVRFLYDVLGLRSILLLLLQTGLFTAMFLALPNNAGKLRDAFPGAVLSSLGWLTFSRLYSEYVEHFSGYAGIYGSVYSVAIGMLWLYFCISIVFYGGVFNCFLMNKRRF
ncbi:MAG: YihY/virulence factor BrkB family protein [Oscillospiraceae bacterium]|nr:YihY/virulence factor BrkB family protein [Oscillospiraceae bacterium]